MPERIPNHKHNKNQDIGIKDDQSKVQVNFETDENNKEYFLEKERLAYMNSVSDTSSSAEQKLISVAEKFPQSVDDPMIINFSRSLIRKKLEYIINHKQIDPSVFEVIKKFHLSKDSKTIISVGEMVSKLLGPGGVYNKNKKRDERYEILLNFLTLFDSTIQDPEAVAELRSEVRNRIIEALREGNFFEGMAEFFREFGFVTDEEVVVATRAGISDVFRDFPYSFFALKDIVGIIDQLKLEHLIQDPEMITIVRDGIIRQLGIFDADDDLSAIVKCAEEFNLGNITEDPEIVGVAKERVLDLLSIRQYPIAVSDYFPLLLKDSDIISLAKKQVVETVNRGLIRIDSFKKGVSFAEKFGISQDPDIVGAIRGVVVEELKEEDLYDIGLLIDSIRGKIDLGNISEDLDAEANGGALKIAQRMLNHMHPHYDTNEVDKFILFCKYLPTITQMPEVVSIVQGMANDLFVEDKDKLMDLIIKLKPLGGIEAFSIIDIFKEDSIIFDLEVVKFFNKLMLINPEITDIIREKMIDFILQMNPDHIRGIARNYPFLLEDQTMMASVRELIIYALKDYAGKLEYATATLAQEFKVIQDDELFSLAKTRVFKLIKDGELSIADYFSKGFNFGDITKDPEMIVSAREGVMNSLKNVDLVKANNIITRFNFGDITKDPEMIVSAREGIIESIRRSDLYNVNNFIENFNFGDITKDPEIVAVAYEIAIKHLKNENLQMAISIVERFNLSLSDKAFEVGLSMFGSFLDHYIYRDLKKFTEAQSSEDIPERLRAFGVERIGESGLWDLRQRVWEFKGSLRDQNYDGRDLDSELTINLFKNFIRYEEAEWGDNSDDFFYDVVGTHRSLSESGQIEKLPEVYEPSEIIYIDKVDKQAQEKFRYSEQFESRYKTLKDSIIAAYGLTKEPKPLSKLVNDVELIRKEVVVTLEGKLEKITNPKGRENLDKRLAALKSLSLRSVKEVENNFTVLSTFKEFEEPLRQFVFYLAMHKRDGWRSGVDEHLTDTPTFDDLSWTIEFIDHITNNETKNKYFKNEKTREAFIKITNARALSEELACAQNQATKGKLNMSFVPTRGLLMEFSGHIADACWATKEISFARNHPNKSAVIMFSNPGTKNERPTGACILIETQSREGEPLLIIRGLNPLENVINGLSVDDFYNKFTDYISNIAKKLNRQLAIVVDDHCGGSGSNRPVMYDYLRKNISKEDKKVELASSEDTTFNGYNIVDDCYLV